MAATNTYIEIRVYYRGHARKEPLLVIADRMKDLLHDEFDIDVNISGAYDIVDVSYEVVVEPMEKKG